MPREKFKTLTEQMFYVLLCLCEERCGIEIFEAVRMMTNDRVKVGSGTLYDLLEQFAAEVIIRETKMEGRRRSYLITEKGRRMLADEYRRIKPVDLNFALVYSSLTYENDPDSIEKQRERDKLYAADGWHPAADRDTLRVYYNEQPMSVGIIKHSKRRSRDSFYR